MSHHEAKNLKFIKEILEYTQNDKINLKILWKHEALTLKIGQNQQKHNANPVCNVFTFICSLVCSYIFP